WRLAYARGAILLFVINQVFGKYINGSRNWIFIGSVSLQPSELIKIAFIFVGASALDRLQTKKNITEFIAFAAVCMGFLFLMRDFGSACIFFAAFLIIAFMRSGSIRTIALILAVAVLGVVMIIYFKPYVAERFAGWGHVWEHLSDSLGYQQTRTLTYIASGGLFGMGLGRGYLHFIAAGNSDLVFGMLCEEQGLMMGAVVLFSLVLFVLFSRSDVKRSRSTFFSISSCAAAGLLLFQACLNIFGATDVLPLTGVTLPFISAGGTSMMAVWGLAAFIKASDERTYAARRRNRRKDGAY
ncbi:MAG: FtsW/RodA/SpoVE family cell cycle protein, partial [Oscillospiraceae bacterium]